MNNRYKSVIEACISNNGNDTVKGMQAFREGFVREMNNPDVTKKIVPSNVSIKALAEAIMDVEGPSDFDWNGDSQRVAEALNTSSFPYITGELIHQALIEPYEAQAKPTLNLVTEFNSSRPNYDYFAGIRAASKPDPTEEGHPYQVREFDEKQCRVELKKYGEIIEITKEMVIADQTGEVVSRAREVGDKLGIIIHRLVIQTLTDQARTDLNESSSTALYYGGSARTVFANTHTTWDLVANDNLGGSVFGSAGLEAAYVLARALTDEAGDYVMIPMRYCLVSPTLFPTAWKWFGAGTPLEPGTGNNDFNFWKDGGGGRPMVVESPYMASTTEWYIGDPTRMARLYWGWKPATAVQGSNSDASFDRDVIQRYKSSMKLGVALGDYRYLIKGNA